MAILKEVDINLIDMVEDNEEIFGYEDLEFFANDIEEEGFHGTVELYAKADGRYELSAGHRRYLVCKMNGIKTIPASIEDDPDEITKAKRLIMSNVHQRTMTPYNWAKALDYYKEKVIKPEREKNKGRSIKDKTMTGSTREILAKAFNLSGGVVQRYLSLLNLIPEYEEFIKSTSCNFTNFELLSYQTKDIQKEVYHNLKGIAVNGDINTLSRNIIEQTINRVNLKHEKEKKQQENEKKQNYEKMNKDENLQTSAGDIIINNNSSFHGFESFPEEMSSAFEEQEEWLNEEENHQTYSADGEVGYFINRINLILENSHSVINDKDKLTKQLKELIERINA